MTRDAINIFLSQALADPTLLLQSALISPR